MIIVRITGGLGNQMFQYAFGRRTAHIRRAPLKLDISWYAGQKAGQGPDKQDVLRTFDLHHFNIAAEPATEAEIARFTAKAGLIRRLRRGVEMRLPWYWRRTVKQPAWHFDAGALRARGNCYLNGTWQSEKHFRDAADVIRNDLSVRSAPQGANARVAERIRQVNAVSVHIRRGDYVANAHTNEFHGLCPLAYYERATGELRKTAPELHFFVFSDDPEWAAAHLKLPGPMEFMAHNGPDEAHEDMRLMSLCRMHIIANSSFSWWGAWLNDDPRKVVIAPAKWFNNSPYDTRDVVPESWIRM